MPQQSYQPTTDTYSAPLAVPLTHESCWEGSGTQYGPFMVVRFNLILTRKPLPGIAYGEAVAHLESPAGADFVYRRLLKYEYETVTTAGMMEEKVVNSDVVRRIRADAKVSTPGFADFSVGANLEEHISSAFRQNTSFEARDSRRITVEREVEFAVKGGTPSAVLAVPYMRESLSVRLNHIDFLTVTYQRRLGGLRVERVKAPPIRERQQHSNIHQSGLLLGELRYWRPVGDASTTLVPTSRHESERINPADVEFVPPIEESRRFYDLRDFRDTPSLYKISNATFPLKKSQRDQAWSNADLLKELEVEPQDAVYIWEANRRWRRRHN